MQYGKIIVKMIDVTELSDYVVRTFSIKLVCLFPKYFILLRTWHGFTLDIFWLNLIATEIGSVTNNMPRIMMCIMSRLYTIVICKMASLTD